MSYTKKHFQLLLFYKPLYCLHTLLPSNLLWVMKPNKMINDLFLKALAEKMIKVLEMMNGFDKRVSNT